MHIRYFSGVTELAVEHAGLKFRRGLGCRSYLEVINIKIAK